MEKKSTSPWTIIGWILLVVVLLSLGFCGLVAYNVGKTQYDEQERKDREVIGRIQTGLETSQRPLYAKLVSLNCEIDKIEVTISNTGVREIAYAKVFLQTQDKSGKVTQAKDTYFSPTTIPAGSRASATVYLNGSTYSTCNIDTIQNTDGERAVVSQK